jgi:hypothetical protein
MTRVAERLVYGSRLLRLTLLGVDGTAVGQLADVVLGPWGGRDAPELAERLDGVTVVSSDGPSEQA